jgi:phosphoribosylformylglycinamidine (FGAM) synthase-like enzyme
LFSESNTRWIIEVYKNKKQDFEKLLKNNNVSFVCIGCTGGKNLTIKDDKKTIINLDIETLRESWRKPIWDIMG